MATGTADDLVTVHGLEGDVVAVGGRGTGALFERSDDGRAWEEVGQTPAGVSGVHVLSADLAVVVGESGYAGWWLRPGATMVASTPVTTDLLHAVWVDPDEDTVWAAGGNWFGTDYTGTLLRGTW